LKTEAETYPFCMYNSCLFVMYAEALLGNAGGEECWAN